MVVRIVPQAFSTPTGFLIGPGRHDFGSAVHSWSVDGQTLPDDPSLDLPASYVQVITPEMGVAGALNQVSFRQDRTRWVATHYPQVSPVPQRLRCCSAGARHRPTDRRCRGQRQPRDTRLQKLRASRRNPRPAGPCRAVCLSRRTERPLGVRLVDGSLGCRERTTSSTRSGWCQWRPTACQHPLFNTVRFLDGMDPAHPRSAANKAFAGLRQLRGRIAIAIHISADER